MNDLMKFA
jgi:hypothetical protein